LTIPQNQIVSNSINQFTIKQFPAASRCHLHHRVVVRKTLCSAWQGRWLAGWGLTATTTKIGFDPIAMEWRQQQTYGNGTVELFTYAMLFLRQICEKMEDTWN